VQQLNAEHRAAGLQNPALVAEHRMDVSATGASSTVIGDAVNRIHVWKGV
jgi:hypothetical protein